MLVHSHSASTSHKRKHSRWACPQVRARLNPERPLHPKLIEIGHLTPPPLTLALVHTRAARAHARILVGWHPGAPAQRKAEGAEGAAARGRGERLARGAGSLPGPGTRCLERPGAEGERRARAP